MKNNKINSLEFKRKNMKMIFILKVFDKSNVGEKYDLVFQSSVK